MVFQTNGTAEDIEMIVRYIRHSISETNEKGLASGSMIDVPLSERGRKLIEGYVSEGIYPRYPGLCYSSTLKRASETLEIIYPDSHIIKTHLLDERYFGSMEYMNKEELAAYMTGISYADLWINREQKPAGDGESVSALMKRIRRSFNTLLDEWFEDEVELVTIGGHGAYLKGMTLVYDIDMPKPWESLLGNGLGCVFDISREDGEYRIRMTDVIGKGGVDKVFNVRKNK